MTVYDAHGNVLGYVDARCVAWAPTVIVAWDACGRVRSYINIARRCSAGRCDCPHFLPLEQLRSSCRTCHHHVEDHAWPSVIASQKEA